MEFTPDLTPQEMLELGIFDGSYFPGDEAVEFPKEWFINAAKENFFGLPASQSLEIWQHKGWIHPQDPLGWFQWYCRYYLGRRSEDDARQIRRHGAMKRHVAQITRNCTLGDLSCRRKQRQALLHWAYDSRRL